MPLKVLTVDDSRTILAMLHHTLSNAGYEVLQAEDGQAGLDMLAAHAVDVVITDINMPIMDGVEFIRRVRQGGNRSLPILVLTTETSRDKRDQGRAAGGTGWIVKPFEPEKLIAVIQRVVH